MNQFEKCKVCDSEIELINAKYNLVKCNKCELIFSKKKYTTQEIISIYNKLYNRSDSHYAKHFEKEYIKLKNREKIYVGRNRSNLILKNVKENTNLLEIGSGVGLVAVFIRQNYKNLNYLGIEIDTSAFQKSKELGINAVNTDFSFIKNLNFKNDTIMLWEVIEHLQDLKEFLNLSYQNLNNNGKLIFSTPNYDKIKNYENKDSIYQDPPPIHLNFFTKENLENILRITGYKSILVKKKKRPYFNLKSKDFYINFIKSIFGKYEGSTLYVIATKR